MGKVGSGRKDQKTFVSDEGQHGITAVELGKVFQRDIVGDRTIHPVSVVINNVIPNAVKKDLSHVDPPEKKVGCRRLIQVEARPRTLPFEPGLENRK